MLNNDAWMQVLISLRVTCCLSPYKSVYHEYYFNNNGSLLY